MKKPDDYLKYNKEAWNRLVKSGNRWTIPVDDKVIRAAKKGEMNVVLTPLKNIPLSWFPDKGSKVLGLASAGGQQCPVFAAAGYDVTVFDNSPEQLNQDRAVADKYRLNIKTVEGDMRDLSVFEDESFDLVFNPCSTGFVDDVVAVYREVARVLKKGGIFMTGFTKPVFHLFDVKLVDQGVFTLKYKSPYSDLKSLSDDELNYFLKQKEPLIFGHSLEEFLNGQLENGLVITNLFEDYWGNNHPADAYFPCFVGTRAVKM